MLEEKQNKNQNDAAEFLGQKISADKLPLVKPLLFNIQNNISQILHLLEDKDGVEADDLVTEKISELNGETSRGKEKIIEGVFDGQNMVGPDGKKYLVPANYASKSKLVEGDILKLTITKGGSFIYKQIGPIERERLLGKLAQDSTTGQYYVLAAGSKFQVLIASVTYFQGQTGDEAVILVPKGKKSRWAGLENIIKGDVKTEDLLTENNFLETTNGNFSGEEENNKANDNGEKKDEDNKEGHEDTEDFL